MSCIFCDIVNKKSESEILYEDEKLIAVNDIRPATEFHFLIIPKLHIANTNNLKITELDLVLEMKRIGLLLSEKHQNSRDQISLGFHVAPFNSIKHLHLHAISPKDSMGFLARLIFKENSFWYKSVDTIIQSIKALEPAKENNL